MSVITRLDGTFVPMREQRTTTGTLSALNAGVDLALNGDESTMIHVIAATTTSSITFEGSVDSGVNYFPVIALPYYALTGGLPNNAQVLLTETFSAVAPNRVYSLATGGLSNIRVRASAYTSGPLSVTMRSGPEFSMHPVMFQRCSTLCVTATGAAGAAVTATLPAVAGLRHYIDRISVVRSATAALTASATPVLVTTTNIPGAPVFTFGADVAGIGIDKEVTFDAGSTGLAGLLINTTTTITCPVYTGVIWRVIAVYRLGL